MKLNYLPTILLFMALLLSSSASAYIVEHHTAITDQGMSQAQGSIILQEIAGYEDYMHACNILTDITVASYFDIDTDPNDKWYNTLLKTVTFKMGKPYRATHDPVACLNNLPEAQNIQEKACGYGICLHQVQDSVPHNYIIPEVVKKTKLSNGLVHSAEEIFLKDEFTTQNDFVKSRRVLDLGYEMTPYLERVFADNPAMQDVDIPEFVDLFIVQVKPDADYTLGFRSFFALPSYIYWFVFVAFFIAIGLLGLTVRKLIDRQINTVTIFAFCLSLLLFAFISAIIYGLLNKNIWEIWMLLTQFIFSPSMYAIGALFLFLGGYVVYSFIYSKNKLDNIGAILVAVFVLGLGVFCMTLPNALDLGHSKMQKYHDLAVQNTVDFFNKGVTFSGSIPDPAGYKALKDADAEDSGLRMVMLIALIIWLVAIIYFTFKPKKNKNNII